ncbi:AI-2E family transporter [Tritonibacter mobilis]|uniref:AI-2E family transporter n=1 Tax=Tritonibacter mobilis F1926 TaxID=1265309 RepID=A0A1B1A0G7_9RHOB|nr:AI-2E family transporter [Tritonibacter mobilis]MCZ4267850.1 AI-2E family transporter [Rhodobacteraceae bacterium G21628-S1]NKX75382.1 AI-2E family transporter [Rhodobacteraceae bacterium R_SAG3]ANP40089.1 AI-2E family transporter [Tritonibacter mobilis F1926]KJZ26452.1 membrane protein [Tritonibacter mobilis]MBU3034963.1 AI-2E family transporter [Tritonibacter mobilis]
MALPARKQLKYWGLAAVLFAVIMWALGNVLMPFILGGAIAYIIDPLADRLERAGLSREGATAVITVGAVLIFLIMLLLIVPALINQMIDLVQTLPQAMSNLRSFAQEHFPSLFEDNSQVREALAGLWKIVQDKSVTLLQTFVGSAMSLLNIVVLLVIVPVVAVYLLVDWDRMVARIDDLLPRDHAPVVRHLAREIDRVLSSFIRGMGMVCVILGSYYAVALMLVGLNFGLAVGFVAGLVTFIPYLGAIIGGVLAIGLALFQFWGAVEGADGEMIRQGTDWLRIALVAGIFVIGQMVEGNFLTPKLVGNSVGLHPVWLLLALSVFGALFGFVGMLIAVPVAAVIGVVARFAVDQYLHSRLYQGLSHRDAATLAPEDQRSDI